MTLQDYLSQNLQDLQLRGMAKATQDNYLHAVRKISEHYHKLPDQITENEVREYFLYLKNVRKYGRPTISKNRFSKNRRSLCHNRCRSKYKRGADDCQFFNNRRGTGYVRLNQ